MPHKNPKVDKAEKNVAKAITDKKGNHGSQAALNRAVVKAAMLQAANDTLVLADDPSSVKDAARHVIDDIDLILDLIEEAS